MGYSFLFGFVIGGFPASVRSATIEADVELEGVVISDPSGYADLALGETATIAIYLVLGSGELASSFEAGFDLSGAYAFDVEIDLGRVDPGLAPLGVGTWTDSEANIEGAQARVSLLREDQGGESLVADIVVSALEEEGLFDVMLADREATGDLDDPPYFIIVPIGTATGTVLATIAVPEPEAAAQSAAALLALAWLIRARRRGESSLATGRRGSLT